MTAWWWIVLCMGMCSGQSPELTPANGNSAHYQQNKILTCALPTFVSGNDFVFSHNSNPIYSHTGPAAGKESKYVGEISTGMVKLTIKKVNMSDSGNYFCSMNFKNSPLVTVSVWSKPGIKIEKINDRPVVTARGIYPQESDLINFTAKIKNEEYFPDRVVEGNADDPNLFDIVWTSNKDLDIWRSYVQVYFNISTNPVYDDDYLWYVPGWLVFLLTILGLLVYCILVLIPLLITAYCCKEPAQWWLRFLLILMLLSIVDSLVIICVLCFCRRSNAARKLKKLFCCGATNDDVEDVVFVLLAINCIPMTLGLILLVPRCVKSGRFSKAVRSLWCGCCDKKNSGDHPIEQRVRHSDPGRDKTDGVSKQKNEHSKALINTPGNANQQLRPQPPLPGIGKSHQQVDEPPHKKTRDLSSNFEDPNSLPQFEVRKHSLAPINVTGEGDGDSTARKKKKKKKKTEGSDTARSDEDN